MRDAIDAYRHAYAERMADWKTNDEQLANAAAVIEADREEARMEERAAIVAWLRESPHFINGHKIADDIEQGRHLK